MEEWFGYSKFLIIDLDAHQGNGHERDHRDKDKYFIIDAYNHAIYPSDHEAEPFISQDVIVHRGMNDREFLEEVGAAIDRAFLEF